MLTENSQRSLSSIDGSDQANAVIADEPGIKAPSRIQLPRSTVRELIRESCDARSRATVEFVDGCSRMASVFLLYLSNTAQQIASRSGRVTIGVSHIQEAMKLVNLLDLCVLDE